MATCPSTAMTTWLASTSAAGRAAGEQDRLTHRVAQGRNPEVVLEFGERLGKGLGDRPGTVDRTNRDAPYLGGDRPRLQQPQRSVRADRPFDILWHPEHPLDLTREPDEPAQRRATEGGAIVRFELDHVSLGGELVVGAVDLAAHERFRTALHGIHDPAVATPRNRVDAEQHATEGRLDQRLDEHRDGTVERAGALAGGQHLLDRGDERIEAANPDDRIELTGHRGCARVFDDR